MRKGKVRIRTITKAEYYRQPPRRLSKLSRLADFLREKLTFKRIVLAALVIPVLFYISREIMHDALIIDPFSVPKGFEETGLTPEVVANRIGDAMRQIETSAQTRMKKDTLTSLHDEGSTPDVEIPGTKLGLKTLVEVTRTVFGIYPKHVSGDIVTLKGTEPSTAKLQVKITVYITQGRSRSQAISLVVDTNDMDVLAQDTAKMILKQVNPYILAAYLYDRDEVDKTVEILDAMVQDPSQDREHVAAALNLLGNVLEDQQKYEEAIAKYKRATELVPKDPRFYFNWGIVLYDERKYDEAIAKYQKATELDPKDADMYTEIGNALIEQKKYDEAVAKFQKAIALNPKNTDAYNGWGKALSKQKKYNEAIAMYQKAIEADPKNAGAYAELGSALVEQKKYDEAIAKFQKAIALDPKNADAYGYWGKAFSEQKKYSEAITMYEKAIELDPTDADEYTELGSVLVEQKKYDEAIAKFQKAIALDPKNADAYNGWGNVLREQKKYGEAEEKFANAGKLSR